MKIIILLSLFALIRAKDHYMINGVLHNKEILFENLPSHFNYRSNPLAVDYTTNDLYLDWYDNSGISVLNINTKELKHITGLRLPQCVTVDSNTHNVYIGTVDGIYKYNGTAKLELIGAIYEDVWSIYHYNGVIYYKTYGNTNNEIRTLVNGQSVSFHVFSLIINFFVVDNKENIVSTSKNGSLFKHKKDTKQDFLYEGIPYVQSLTTDRYGNVYFSVKDGIYRVKGDVAERVVTIDNPTYIAFDGDNNIIYYNEEDSKLYRLKPAHVINSSSDRPTYDKEVDVTKDNSSVMRKIDNLAQIMLTLEAKVDQLQSDVQQLRAAEERHNVESSPQWIRLETGSIPICRGEAGPGQVLP